MPNELFVLKKIKEGDIKVFEGIFRQYYSPLYFYALSITNKQEVAEEIVQDLFYHWWKEREKIQIHHSVKNYLYRAVRNKSFQYLEHCNVCERYRQNVLSTKSEAQDPTPHEELEQKELQGILNLILEKLPERRLKIFRMHRFEGKKYKEIAEVLSLSVKTIEAEISKTHRLLQKEIDKYNRTL